MNIILTAGKNRIKFEIRHTNPVEVLCIRSQIKNIPDAMEVDKTRTRFELENYLNENKVQFVRIRHKNVYFVLCQFQNRNSKHSFCKYNTNL